MTVRAALDDAAGAADLAVFLVALLLALAEAFDLALPDFATGVDSPAGFSAGLGMAAAKTSA